MLRTENSSSRDWKLQSDTHTLKTWAKCVFLALNNLQEEQVKNIIDVLEFSGKLGNISLVQETENLPYGEAEKRIQDQVKVFWD